MPMAERTEERTQGGTDGVLGVLTLGPTRLKTGDGIHDADWLAQRPGQLFKLLVTRRPRVVHAEEIAEALWPGADAGAIGNVRHFVHAVRQHLEPHRAKHSRGVFVTTRSGGYVLDLTHVTVDADQFEDHVNRAVEAQAAGDPQRAIGHLDAAMALYRGDFLEDEPYAEWALAERDRLRVLAGRALELLARIHLEREDREAALVALQRLGDLEPLDVEVQCGVIALSIQTGRRGQALRRYEALRRRLSQTFGEELDVTLADIAKSPPERFGILGNR